MYSQNNVYYCTTIEKFVHIVHIFILVGNLINWDLKASHWKKYAFILYLTHTKHTCQKGEEYL